MWFLNMNYQIGWSVLLFVRGNVRFSCEFLNMTHQRLESEFLRLYLCAGKYTSFMRLFWRLHVKNFDITLCFPMLGIYSFYVVTLNRSHWIGAICGHFLRFFHMFECELKLFGFFLLKNILLYILILVMNNQVMLCRHNRNSIGIPFYNLQCIIQGSNVLEKCSFPLMTKNL